MRKLYLYILSLFLIISCASKEERKFSDQVSPDLTKVFNLNDKKFDKFRVSEIPVTSNTSKKKNKVKKEIVKINKTKKNNKNRPEKKILKKKKIAVTPKITSTKDKEVVIVTKDKALVLPDGFPKEFLKYDKKSQAVWSKFRPHFFPGEKFVISLSYLGVTAGHIHIQTKNMVRLDDRETYHFVARLKSADFYKYVYSLDDTVESFISKESFLPVKYTLSQRESGQTVDDLQLFDHEKRKTFFWYKRLKKGKVKTKHVEEFVPNYFQDSFSSLYFVRGLPLKNGDLYEFPVMTRGKVWLIKMKVTKRENIEIMDKDIRAIKVVAETHFPGVLKKKGDIHFWYSDDSKRKLLKFQANVKIGALKGELVDYTSGTL